MFISRCNPCEFSLKQVFLSCINSVALHHKQNQKETLQIQTFLSSTQVDRRNVNIIGMCKQ